MTNDWDSYRDDQEMTDEEKDAFAVAESVSKPSAEIIPSKRRRNTGTKRRLDHSSLDRPPLDGVSQERSNLIRHVVGLKYSGNTLREACASASLTFDVKPHTVENYWYKHAKAVELATAEHLENALRDFHFNLIAGRALMSEAVPLSVKTLTKIMRSTDKKSTPNVKSKAAIAILKMAGIGIQEKRDPSDEAANENLKLIKEMRENASKEKESHVVDAEDVEILEGNDSEHRTDGPVQHN